MISCSCCYSENPDVYTDKFYYYFVYRRAKNLLTKVYMISIRPIHCVDTLENLLWWVCISLYMFSALNAYCMKRYDKDILSAAFM